MQTSTFESAVHVKNRAIRPVAAGTRGGGKRNPCRTVVRWTASVSFALLPTTMSLAPVHAQEHIALPPVNLGGTTFLDGVGGPGFLVRETLSAFDARHFDDASGAAVPGHNTLFAFTSLTLVAYMAPFTVLGGHWGVEALVPVVYLHLTTPGGTVTTSGVGDLTVSPLVWEAPQLPLLGGQLCQRLDVDIVAPTGRYASTAPIDAGSNLWSVNPYYAFTWLATDRIETSWRLHYLWNSKNNSPSPAYEATSIQPGQAVHVNGAASFAVLRQFRVGVAGYFLRQITNSKANGQSVSGSQEQLAGLGPGVLATAGPLVFVANVYGEFAVENRPQGTRVSVSAMGVW
jgi:hypothetical protein